MDESLKESVKNNFYATLKQNMEISTESGPKPFNYKATVASAQERILEDINQLDERNIKYSDLLQQFLDDYKARKRINKHYKSIFFHVFMTAFVLILIVTVAYIVFATLNISKTNISMIAGLVTAAATLITSILTIPQIIAKYLFSIEEDKFMSDIIKSMLTQDDKIRESLNNIL